MILSRLKIHSFKSLEDLDIELGQFNVFIGANGSGKSNLLEGIGVLGAAASGRVDDESLLRRGVRLGVPRLFKSAFPHARAESRPHIFFSGYSSGAKYEVSLWNPLSDPKPAWRFKTELFSGPEGKICSRSPYRKEQLKSGELLNHEQGLAALYSVRLQEQDSALKLLNRLRNYCIYSANTPTLRGQIIDQQTRDPVGLSGGRLPEAMRELKDFDSLFGNLNEVSRLIDWALSFDTTTPDRVPLSPSVASSKKVIRFKDRFMSKSRNDITGYDASEGALYILFSAVLALHERSPQFLAIDNFDQALNPRLVKLLTHTFSDWVLQSKTKQVLLTAQNAAVLDGLPLGDDRVRLFSVDRSNVGHTVVKRIVISEDLKQKAENGWTLSRLWTNGLIGGVPDF